MREKPTEDPASINDANFALQMPTTGNCPLWVDNPSKLHGSAGSFGFADSQAELHGWANINSIPTTTYKGEGNNILFIGWGRTRRSP